MEERTKPKIGSESYVFDNKIRKQTKFYDSFACNCLVDFDSTHKNIIRHKANR